MFHVCIKLLIHNFFKTFFDTKGEILTGLYLALSLGSSFLYIGAMSLSFKVSSNFLFVKPSLSFGKQKSLLFSTLIGISSAVALSHGKFSTTFLTVGSETFKREFSVYSKLLLYFKDTRMV